MPITINGRYSSAVIYTSANEETALDGYAQVQIQNLCNNEVSMDSVIRIMPDVHPGKVCTIGLTMTIGKRIMPEVLGLDLGCGITVAKVRGVRKEWQKLDSLIQKSIPSGFNHRKEKHRFTQKLELTKLNSFHHIREDSVLAALGTLGGGNHFIEVNVDSKGDTYLMVHSGSRSLGAELSAWYLNVGHRELAQKGIECPYELTWLEGCLKEQYLEDADFANKYASLNRLAIISDICKGMKWKVEDTFESIHNYADISGAKPLLRKGAISAKKDERVIIPANMKDGAILGIGLGNADWNYSAPHGSGRIYNRKEVKNHFTVSAFKKEMKGIYSSCIGKETLDEAPFAYRSLEEIKFALKPTVEVLDILKPVYNFKAGEQN